jgi:hypothetical protein
MDAAGHYYDGWRRFFISNPESPMKSLYDPSAATEIKERVARLTPTSQRVWGKMTVSQMLAHCANSLEEAVGDQKPRRLLIGRVLGPMVKRRLLGEGPMKRNAPTAPELRIVDERDLERERQRLVSLVDRFGAAGPAGCTSHPHTFFGPMTADEWGRLMYKHLDHHLTQFSA